MICYPFLQFKVQISWYNVDGLHLWELRKKGLYLWYLHINISVLNSLVLPGKISSQLWNVLWLTSNISSFDSWGLMWCWLYSKFKKFLILWFPFSCRQPYDISYICLLKDDKECLECLSRIVWDIRKLSMLNFRRICKYSVCNISFWFKLQNVLIYMRK